jgi:3-methyladenine DNA glycosylase AlkD
MTTTALVASQARDAIAALKAKGSKKGRDSMARYAIPSDKAFGVGMKDIQALAKKLGKNHALAGALWDSGWYEARLLAAYVDEPAKVTAAQMDRWCRDFDSWAVVDTVCFVLFDKTPHAWKKVGQWAKRSGEFQKRAAFALLASLVLHDRKAGEAPFLEGLALIEAGAADERNFVKKGVNWALRCIGKESAVLNKAAVAVAKRLAASSEAAPRWVGKDALRELSSPTTLRRIAAKKARVA